MRVVSGRMKLEWPFVRSAKFALSSRKRAPITSSWHVRAGLARGVHKPLAADGRFSSRAALNEVQFCMKTQPSPGGFPEYQMVSGSNPVDPYVWHGRESNSEFAQDRSTSEQFVQP